MAIFPSKISIGAALCLFLASGVLLFPKASSDTAPAALEFMPANVAQVFERACKDCHSNRTEWPWYSRLPPMQMAITADVNKGRAFFNLSEWDRYTRGQKRGFLTAIQMDVQKGKMPPVAYRWMHLRSRLTQQDRALLAGWAREEGTRLRLQAAGVAKENFSSPR